MSKVPGEVSMGRIEIGPNSSDENEHLLKISGTILIFLKFGTYVVKTDVYVCEGLSGHYILGGDFLYQLVEDIKPQKKTVELDDGTDDPIVQKPGTRAEKQKAHQKYSEGPQRVGRISNVKRVAKHISLQPQAHSMVILTINRLGFISMTPFNELYD